MGSLEGNPPFHNYFPNSIELPIQTANIQADKLTVTSYDATNEMCTLEFGQGKSFQAKCRQTAPGMLHFQIPSSVTGLLCTMEQANAGKPSCSLIKSQSTTETFDDFAGKAFINTAPGYTP